MSESAHLPLDFTPRREINTFLDTKHPENRNQLIQRIRQEIKDIYILDGKDTRPTVEQFDRYKSLVTDEFYSNPSQARKSDHNIEHATTVWALSLGIAQYYSYPRKFRPEACTYDMNALAIGAFLHDSKRQNDISESVFALQAHGERAAEYIRSVEGRKQLEQRLGQLSDSTINNAARVCQFHDNEYRPKPDENCDELMVVAGADRSTLPRILFSYHKNIASYLGQITGIYRAIVWRRAKKYEVKDHEDLMDTFLPIGTLLCLMTRENIEQGTPEERRFDLEDQYEAVRKAAIDLGLLRTTATKHVAQKQAIPAAA